MKKIIGLFMSFVMIATLLSSFAIDSNAIHSDVPSGHSTASDITADDLSALVSSCSNYRSNCWEELSWAFFKNAFNSAVSVLSTDYPSSYSIKRTYNTLSSARASLVHNGAITECSYCLGESKAIEEDDVIYLKKVFYGSDRRNFMDLYIPKNIIGNCSSILYIHGGGWTTGSNAAYTKTAKEDCMKYGVVTAALIYRFADKNVDCFDMLDDIQACVAKIKEVCATYGLNVNKLMTTGVSAGAHLAMMYSYSRADVSSVKPVCVFEQSGPSDLTDPVYWESHIGREEIKNCLSWLSGTDVSDEESQMENAQALRSVSPLYYINENTVPTVICHGKRDITVDYSEALKLAEAFEQYGVDYELLTFNANHDLSKDKVMTEFSQTVFGNMVNSYLYGNCPYETHRYVSSVVPKTCTQDGYVFNVCVDCGMYYVSDVDKASHDLVTDFGYEATCTQPGLTDGCHCARCGAIVAEREVAKPLGHDFGANVTEPTCTEEGYTTYKCSRCDESYVDSYVDALGHDVVADEAVEPTCTQTGLTAGEHCARCNEVFEAQEVIPATGHTIVEDEAVEPTCTQAGLASGEHCSVCNAVIVEQETVSALGHDYVSEVTTAPGCTTNGVRTYSCTRCHDTYTQTIEAAGHEYSYVVTAPTCTEDGYTTYNCSACGDTYVDSYVDALGHIADDEWTVITPATCTATGTKVKYCTVCGKIAETETIAIVQHIWNDGEITTAPNCTKAGVKTYTCSACDATITEEVAALGHDYKAAVTAPTCTEDGYTTYTCSACADTYVDSYVDALGHDVVEDEAVEPTCTQTGLTSGKHCSVCNAVLEEQEIISAKGHTAVVEIVVPATYTSEGTRVTRCSVCGEVISTQAIPELEPEFFVRDEMPLKIDFTSNLVSNIPQGTENLSEYFNLEGCTVVVSDEIVATGTEISIKSLSNETLASFKAVVGGDITGDGYVDAFDTALAGEYVNTFTEPEDAAFMESIDLFDDEFIDVNDLAFLISIANFAV